KTAMLAPGDGRRKASREIHYAFLLLAACLGLTAAQPTHAGPPAAPGDKTPARKQPAHTDCYGDPRPEGAVARLGTTRLRPGEAGGPIALSPDGKTLLTGEAERLRHWDIETGKETCSIALPEAWQVDRILFSADGAHAAAIGVKRRRDVLGESSGSWVYVA